MTHPAAEPIPVVVANAGEIADYGKRRHIRATFRTFILTAANPVWPVLAEDRSRRVTYLIAYANSVILCDSESQAQDPANAIAGAGAFSNTPANPQGTLLYCNPAATAPVTASVRWTTGTTEVMWATALAFPAILAVTIHNEARGY